MCLQYKHLKNIAVREIIKLNTKSVCVVESPRGIARNLFRGDIKVFVEVKKTLIPGGVQVNFFCGILNMSNEVLYVPTNFYTPQNKFLAMPLFNTHCGISSVTILT